MLLPTVSSATTTTPARTTTSPTTTKTPPLLACRPPGPVVPRPRNLSSSPRFLSAASNLASILDSALALAPQNSSSAPNPGFSPLNTSFSVGLVSWDQEDKAVPLWEHHHLGSRRGNAEGTRELGRDSQYLVGSISKVFSDYLLLRSGGVVDPDARVADLVPELLGGGGGGGGGEGGGEGGGGGIAWGEITLRMLGSHLGGIPPNCEFLCFVSFLFVLFAHRGVLDV